MKIIISENKFKSMITKMVGYTLSKYIDMITNWEELTSSEKDNVFGGDKKFVNMYLNKYGPMYRFSIKQGEYLAQNQEGRIWFIVDANSGHEINYYDFLKMINLDMTGISLGKIIDEFVEE